MPQGIKKLRKQADATSWMAMYSISICYASLPGVWLQHNPWLMRNPPPNSTGIFSISSWAMHHIGKKDISLWDEQDSFYYDAIQFENGKKANV